jgi:large subunit ribosomal protein L29
MAGLKPADLRIMTVDAIDGKVLELKKEQFNLRFQRATGQLANTARVREVRRDIARLKTVAQQKRAGATAPAPKQAPAGQSAAKSKPRRGARTKAKAE